MLIILDHSLPEGPSRRVFRAPLRVLAVDHPAQVPGILDAVENALAQGHHVAGWLGYELGYVLEPRLASRAVNSPLLRLGVFEGPQSVAPLPTGRVYAGPLKPEWKAQDYAARFDQVKDLIAAGDIYQANLSLRARFAFLGDPRALYEKLRAQSGAGHCGYVDDGERQILSLSPELFFNLTADGALTVRPMKGTAPREGNDAAERTALAASPKNRAENLMIVDLIRNDLSRIASAVTVSDLFKVETYPTLHTMVSTVTAQKRPGVGARDILRALFPCGSVTGAPKICAMEILRDLESSPRGAYCGAVGHFAPDGSAHFNVAIRTLTLEGGRGTLGIGGGVVQDSQPVSEYAECLLKARFFENARQPLELIETLRWDGKFLRLSAHLARMEKSAEAFGMAFDPAAARAALDAAVAAKPGPLRVRLTLNEAGEHHATTHDLPPNPAHWTYSLSPDRTDSRDLLLRHKTSRRELYDRAHPGVDEVIFCNERGALAEGARSNIFVERGGILLTPRLSAGVLPGILRAELIAQGRTQEADLTPADLQGAVWLGNSLRGLIRAIRS